jgi:hypothetical protein
VISWTLVATTTVAAIAVHLLGACSFSAPDHVFQTPKSLYSVLDSAPYADDATVSGSRWRVIDAPKLKVDHGYTCASAPRAAESDFIGMRVFDSATLPANFDGTVLLNGWYLEYEQDDHNVGGLGTVIFNIVQNGNELSWDAGGVISDRNGDDEYGWCYRYTVIAWAKNLRSPIGGLPKPHIDMHATHADATGNLVYVDSDLDSSHRKMAAGFWTSGSLSRAKLLAGFGVGFGDDDHHLLQFGFDLGVSRNSRKSITWNTDVLLKDNSKRDYRAAQVETILMGESVRSLKPDTVLLEAGHPQAPGYIKNDLKLKPWGGANVCIGGGETRHDYHFKISGVPFTWAVPMLTGWEVGDVCNDQHVKKMGAWIEDFSWERNPGDSTGTLHYTVRTIFEDKDPDTGIVDGMQVEVLGINLLEPPGVFQTFESPSADTTPPPTPAVSPDGRVAS